MKKPIAAILAIACGTLLAALLPACASQGFVREEIEKSQVVAAQQVDALRSETAQRFDVAVRELETSLQAQKAESERVLAEQRARMDEPLKQLTAIVEESRGLVARVETLDRSLQELNLAFQARNRTLKDEIIQTVGQDLQAQGATLQQLRQQILDSRVETTDLAGKITENQKEILLIHEDLTKLTGSIASFNNTLAVWKKLIDSLALRQRLSLERDRAYLIQRMEALNQALDELLKDLPASTGGESGGSGGGGTGSTGGGTGGGSSGSGGGGTGGGPGSGGPGGTGGSQ